MTRYASGMTAAIVVLLLQASSGWSQQLYLCAPTTAGNEVKASGKDGVLVQDVKIRKGDTLSGISRKFSGHGSYFPQILLFNDIKNPDKIYPGTVFKIPVTRSILPRHVGTVPAKKEASLAPGAEAAATVSTDSSAVMKPAASASAVPVVTGSSAADLKKADAGRNKKRSARDKSAVSGKKQGSIAKRHAAVVSDSASGQLLYERALKAYRQEDYRAALDFFDRFLAEHRSSPLAADASLYKAECYLKLSAQN